jgi:hypothetical protein
VPVGRGYSLLALLLVSRALIFPLTRIDLCFHDYHPCFSPITRKSPFPAHADIEPIPTLAAAQFTIDAHIGKLGITHQVENLLQKSAEKGIAEPVVLIGIHQPR